MAACAVAVAAETPPAIGATGLTLGGMSYALARGSASEVLIEAESAQVSPVDGRVELAGVRARLGSFAGAGSQVGGLELTCEGGTLDVDAREFQARGRVEGRTGDGRVFRTERLRYRHDQGVVATDAPVWIRDAAGTYRGGGFRYWVRENRFRLVGGASIVRGGP